MLIESSEPRVVATPEVRRALAIAAHPDDIESWCAGTLARLIDAGTDVDYLLLTSGDKGAADPSLAGVDVARLREAEQEEAARRLGARSVTFLRQPDGELEDSAAMRGEVVRQLRRLRPDVVFTHDPEHPYPPYLTHRDHRVAGRLALDAVYPAARDARSFPEHRAEGLAPHAVPQVWLFASAAPRAWVDISATLERKIAARLAHASQTADPDALRSGWRERAARIGAPVGLACAEAFVVLRPG